MQHFTKQIVYLYEDGRNFLAKKNFMSAYYKITRLLFASAPIAIAVTTLSWVNPGFTKENNHVTIYDTIPSKKQPDQKKKDQNDDDGWSDDLDRTMKSVHRQIEKSMRNIDFEQIQRETTMAMQQVLENIDFNKVRMYTDRSIKEAQKEINNSELKKNINEAMKENMEKVKEEIKRVKKELKTKIKDKTC